jgi:hypothetical protein
MVEVVRDMEEENRRAIMDMGMGMARDMEDMVMLRKEKEKE